MSWWDKYVHKSEAPWAQSKSTNLPPWKCFQYDISAFIEMSEFVWQTSTRHKHETPEARLRPQDLPCQLTGTPFSPLNLSPKSQLQILKISPSKVCFNFIPLEIGHHQGNRTSGEKIWVGIMNDEVSPIQALAHNSSQSRSSPNDP